LRHSDDPAFRRIWLPAAWHSSRTLDEIEARFGQASEVRRAQMESIRWMVELAVRAGAERIILNGSFVTDIMEPNDVDCVLLIGPNYPTDATAEEELDAGLPFLDIAVAEDVDFDRFVSRIFAVDRFGEAKGMIDVIR
jgi:hypothetical protein